MFFKYEFRYKCWGCGWVYSQLRSGEKGDEPPTLPGGVRTRHNEMGETTRVFNERVSRWESVPIACGGLMKFEETRLLLDREAELLSKASFKCIADGIGDTKSEYQATLTSFWGSMQGKGKLDASMTIPDDMWEKLREACNQRRKQLDAAQPKNPSEAVALAIQYKTNVEGRTLCVAFNKASKRFKTGSSGGKNTRIWSRGLGGLIQCSNPDVRLQPLTDALNGVNKKPQLGREVWVCAETDATVKALLEGWRFGDLAWAAKEYQNSKWRDINACGHCSQWANY